MQIAKTILEQIGGSKFIAMTGAKDFVGGDRMLMFRLPAKFAKDGINKVRIVLAENDTYTVSFFKLRGMDCKVIAERDNVYFDAMPVVFEQVTGLALSI